MQQYILFLGRIIYIYCTCDLFLSWHIRYETREWHGKRTGLMDGICNFRTQSSSSCRASALRFVFSLSLSLLLSSVYFLEDPLSRLIFFPILFPLLRRNNNRGYQWLLIYRHRSLDGDIRLHTACQLTKVVRIRFVRLNFLPWNLYYFFERLLFY